MLEYVKGKIAECSPAHVVIDCNGVGYFLNISLNCYTKLELLQEAQLYLYENIREDAYTLFGFFDREEREMFKLLISVSGVGANTARMMLSSLSVEEMAGAITSENINLLKGIKGIGLKTAQRLVVELKDKVEKKSFDTKIIAAVNNTIREEALSALVMLGFVKASCIKVVDKLISENPEAKVETIIKKSLSML